MFTSVFVWLEVTNMARYHASKTLMKEHVWLVARHMKSTAMMDGRYLKQVQPMSFYRLSNNHLNKLHAVDDELIWIETLDRYNNHRTTGVRIFFYFLILLI